MPRSLALVERSPHLGPARRACGMAEDNLAVVANAPGTFAVGEPQRLMVGLVDDETADFLASPDLAATAVLTSPDEQDTEVDAEFMWTVPDVVGLYLVRTTFDQEGTWWVRLRPEGLGPTHQAAFTVSRPTASRASGTLPPRSRPAPCADHSIEEISSDDDPDPDFYQMSLDDAFGQRTSDCGRLRHPGILREPDLRADAGSGQGVAPGHPDANFLHVEIYENLDATSADDLIIVPAVMAWGLPSEPWVFVIDAEGIVTARFEGAMMTSELEAALEAVGA